MKRFLFWPRGCAFMLAAICAGGDLSFAQTTFERTYGSSGTGSSVQQTPDGEYIIAGSVGSGNQGKLDICLIKTDSAGDTLWTRTYGGPQDDWASSVQQTSDGGYVIAGIVSYDPGDARGAIWLLKIDSSGDTLWTRTLGWVSHASPVQQTYDGGYIITSFGAHIQAGYSSSSLIKTSPTGEVLWTKQFTIPPGKVTTFGRAYAVRQTSDSGYIIAGDCRSSVFLMKTDASGDTLWIKTYFGAYDEAHSVQQTFDNGYIIAGNTTHSGRNGGDILLVRTNPRGDTLWTRTYGGPGHEYGYSVQQTSDSGFIVVGSTSAFESWDGKEDVYLVRTNSSGDTLWTRTYGGPLSDAGYSVQETSDGGFIITGGSSSFSFDSQRRVYLIKTDANGLVASPGNFEAFFSGRVDLSTGSFPWSTAAADLDGDGKVDLAASIYDENQVALFRNIGTAGRLTTESFAERVTFPSGTGPTGIVCGDFDSDGKVDLAVSNAMSSSVSIFRNISVPGTLQFASGVDIPVAKDPKVLAVGDLDGDGKQDLVIPNEGDSSITILRNVSSAGSIAFSPLPVIRVGQGPLKTLIADLDRDGLADIAVVNNASGSISLFRNVSKPGTMSLASPVPLATGSSPGRMALADIDADDAVDLVVDNINEGNLSLHRNTSIAGSFSFSSSVGLPAGKQPWSVTAGDFNGDGRSDVAVTNYSDSTVTVFINTSQVGVIAPNSLQNVGTLRTGANPLNVELQDLDGDGRSDLVVACRGSNVLSLFRNKWDALALPAVIGLVAPADSAAVDKDSVQLVWTPASAAVDRYQLWVAADQYFWGTVIQTELAGTSSVLHNLTGGKTYWWKVAAENASGMGRYSPSRCFTTLLTGINEKQDNPREFSLGQNFPNPFNPTTTIRYGLPHRSHVTLTVFNLLGQQVAQLVNDEVEAGYHEVKFDRYGLASGVYMYRMQARDFVQVEKLVILK